MTLGTKQSEKTGRINLFVDGEFIFSVNARIFAEQFLRDGDEITEEQLEELRKKEEYHAAYEKGLRVLDYNDNSAKELYRKISQQYSAEASAAAVEKLKSLGLVDDVRFADNLAESLFRRKGFAKSRIAQEIMAKGVSRDIAYAAVEKLECDEEEALKNAIAKMTIDYSDRKSVAKAYRKLYAMGFRGFRLGDFADDQYDT